ncbi:hypothetical protein MMPV_005032 [Pyropia vietnamensis]
MSTLMLLSAALDASQAARDRVFMTCRGCGWQQHIRRSRCSHCGAAKVVATEPKRKKKRKRPSAAAAAAAAAAAGAAGELPPPPPGALSIVLGDDNGVDGVDGGDGDDGPTRTTTSSALGGSGGGGDGVTTTAMGQGQSPRRRPATVDVVVVPNKAAAEARIVSHVAHLSSMLGEAAPPPPATPASRGRRAESACTPGTSSDDMSSLTLGRSASSGTASPPPQPSPPSLRPAKRRAVVKVEVPPIGGGGDPPARWCDGPDVPGWEGVPLDPLLNTTADTLDSWSRRGEGGACGDTGLLTVAAAPAPDCLLLPPASTASPRGVCDSVFEVLGADHSTLEEGGVGGEADGLCGLFGPLPDLSGEPFF